MISLICGIFIKRKVLEKEIRLVVARGGGWGKGKLQEGDQKVET